MSEPPELGAADSASDPTSSPVQITLSTGEGASLLDYILIVGALLLVAYGMHGLMAGKQISADVLPIIASLLSFITGTILGGYAGFRWGASASRKAPAAASAS